MNGISIIPDKIENVGIINGVDFDVDTKGLNCRIKPEGGAIVIKLTENGQTYHLKDGESLDFCGKLYYRYASGSPFVNLFYYHTL